MQTFTIKLKMDGQNGSPKLLNIRRLYSVKKISIFKTLPPSHTDKTTPNLSYNSKKACSLKKINRNPSNSLFKATPCTRNDSLLMLSAKKGVCKVVEVKNRRNLSLIRPKLTDDGISMGRHVQSTSFCHKKSPQLLSLIHI